MKRTISLTAIVSALLLFSVIVSAQDFPSIDGEVVVDIAQTNYESILVGARLSLLRTEKQITIYAKNIDRDDGGGRLGHPIWNYVAPAETRIVSAAFKSDDPGRILVLLSDKSMLIFEVDDGSDGGEEIIWNVTVTPRNPLDFISNPLEIIGDAVYALGNGKIYVSRDTAKTWAIDSVNIGTLFVQDIAMDTNQYAWIATFEGIFYQHPDSNIWRKTSPLPGTFQTSYAIFVDRKNRIFVTKPGAVYVSTDRGASWTDVSDGITGNMMKYGDDVFGTIYATGVSGSYRLENMTPPWKKISDSIGVLSYLPTNTNQITAITGDSVIVASTRFGAYESSDKGTNWKPVTGSGQSRAHIFYSLVIGAKNFRFISTNLGVFRSAFGDTAWQKVFPKQGFISGVNAIASDSAGNLYGNFPFKTGPSSSIFIIVKSTDNGATWVPDTSGFASSGIFSGSQFFDHLIDRNGMQYLKGNGRLYSKRPGQQWKIDTTGLGIKTNEFVSDVTLNNKKGIVYASRSVGGVAKIYMRSVADSVWVLIKADTLSTSEARIFSDHQGNFIARTLSGSYKLWRFDGSVWTNIPLPPGMSFAQYLTIDKNGTLWGAFFGGGNKGIYFTTNNGTQWKYVGLEKVGIKNIATIGDTAYVVTFIDGVKAFTTSSQPTSVGEERIAAVRSYELYQNYPNPFNPTTTIEFALPTATHVSLTVYDILGREVKMLVNEVREVGRHAVPFNASHLSSGMYIYRLKAEGFTLSKKLLLIR